MPNTSSDCALRLHSSVMKIFCVIYVLCGLLFFFLHSVLEDLLKLPRTEAPFWIVLSLAMLFMLAYLSWKASKQPHETGYTHCHLLSKATSVLAFLGLYLFSKPLPAYLVGALTDAAVFAVVSYIHCRMRRSCHAG